MQSKTLIGNDSHNLQQGEKVQGAEPFSLREKPSRKKAQGAIEYLLIVGAAILIVAVVIMVIVSSVQEGQAQGDTANADKDLQTQKMQCLGDCDALGTDCRLATSCSKFTTLCKAGTGGVCLKK